MSDNEDEMGKLRQELDRERERTRRVEEEAKAQREFLEAQVRKMERDAATTAEKLEALADEERARQAGQTQPTTQQATGVNMVSAGHGGHSARAAVGPAPTFVYAGDTATLGERFGEWLGLFELHLIAARADREDKASKAAFLLAMGKECRDILKAKGVPESAALDDIVTALKKVVVEPKSRLVERCKFARSRKHVDEKAVDFALRLRGAAAYCDFADLEGEILSRFIVGYDNEELQRRCCMEESNLTLDKAIQFAVQCEQLAANVRGLNNPTEAELASRSHLVNFVRGGQNQRAQGRPGPGVGSRTPASNRCGSCGRGHGSKEVCRAKDKTCDRCGKIGHFKSVCRTPQEPASRGSGSTRKTPGTRPGWVNAIATGTGERGQFESEFAAFLKYKKQAESGHYQINAIAENDGPRVTAAVMGSEFSWLIDTGSPINVLPWTAYRALREKPVLKPCTSKFYSFQAESPIEVRGQFVADIQVGGRKVKAGFIVVQGDSEKLLSFKTATALGVVKIVNVCQIEEKGPAVTTTVSGAQSKQPPDPSQVAQTADALRSAFPRLFRDELGCLKGVRVKLDVDETVRPVRQSLRPVPIHLLGSVERELREQVRQGVLEPIDASSGPTPWLANLVIVAKEKSVAPAQAGKKKPISPDEPIRLTCDSRGLNKAIRRQHYPCRTVDELVHMVNGAKVLSKVDIKKAFHQLELDESSRNLTAITTPFGLFRYRKLHMGISCASEIFSESIRTILEGLPCQVNMMDDILVWGVDEADHHRNLLAVLSRLEQFNVTLNAGKCEFYRRKLTFFGLSLSDKGIAITEDRLRALREVEPPANEKALRSFLCSLNYSSRFAKMLCSKADPLWQLTKAGAAWKWGEEEQRALDAVKAALSDEANAYFDKTWDTEVHVDASPVGLGAVLAQRNPRDKAECRIVGCASRLLSPTERRYSQCEKEAAAAVYGPEHFQHYLWGKTFKLFTDNRAVQLLFANTKSKMPARIERLALRLRQFDYEVVHEPGESNVADYYSRHPGRECQAKTFLDEVAAEQHINFVARAAMPAAISMAEVAEATKRDATLTKLIAWIRSEEALRRKLPPELTGYKDVVQELSVTESGVVLRGYQVVIPDSMRERVLNLAHQGHQGIVKTKSLVRARVWFPGIDAQVERRVKGCLECQANSDSQSYEPLRPSPMPPGQWQHVSGDFFGPMRDGTYWFVNICDYSRWVPPIQRIASTAMSHVQPVLDQLFDTVGVPAQYRSDNGPPFNSARFAEFARQRGFEHRKTTPLWPRANAEAEAFMKNLGKVLRTADVAGQDKDEALRAFVRAYNDTPHSTTKVAPRVLMFGRGDTSGLPQVALSQEQQEEQQRAMHELAQANDEKAKRRMKAEFDERMKARGNTIEVGSRVLMKQERTHKHMSAWDPVPFVVIEVKGSMVTASRGDRVTTRNSSFFKLFRHEWEGERASVPRTESAETAQGSSESVAVGTPGLTKGGQEANGSGLAPDRTERAGLTGEATVREDEAPPQLDDSSRGGRGRRQGQTKAHLAARAEQEAAERARQRASDPRIRQLPRREAKSRPIQ